MSSATPISQVYKLPVFVTHFIEHDQGGNFFSEMKVFLVHHYGGHPKDDDWQTDQKLPFMQVEIAHFVQITIPIFRLKIPEPLKTEYQEPILSKDERVNYSYYLNSIWQPPKYS